jgi:hypothetical protein
LGKEQNKLAFSLDFSREIVNFAGEKESNQQLIFSIEV